MERRFCPFELRAVRETEGEGTTLEGYAALFGVLSVEMWGFREKIAPGFFADSIASDDIRSLWNHDTNWVLARTTNETLELWEDETGLAFRLKLPDTQIGRDAAVSITRGDVSQMSFGFATLDAKWDIDENEQYIRTLLRGKLYEISPVTFPAYPDTSVSVRGMVGADPVWGDMVEIPAELRRASGSAAVDAEARARAAYRRRTLRLME